MRTWIIAGLVWGFIGFLVLGVSAQYLTVFSDDFPYWQAAGELLYSWYARFDWWMRGDVMSRSWPRLYRELYEVPLMIHLFCLPLTASLVWMNARRLLETGLWSLASIIFAAFVLWLILFQIPQEGRSGFIIGVYWEWVSPAFRLPPRYLLLLAALALVGGSVARLGMFYSRSLPRQTWWLLFRYAGYTGLVLAGPAILLQISHLGDSSLASFARIAVAIKDWLEIVQAGGALE